MRSVDPGASTGTTPAVSVRRADPADIPTLAAVLTAAFARDPFMQYIARDATERNQRMREAWSGILRFASAGLSETWTTDDCAGVGIWIPPGRKASALLDSLLLARSMARLAGWRRLRDVADSLELLERRRRVHAPHRHWYLSALGVDPARQGRGIGSALLTAVLPRADAERLLAYLETATAHNVLLYERHGFEVVEELILPRTDIRGWLMLRHPSAARSPAAERS